MNIVRFFHTKLSKCKSFSDKRFDNNGNLNNIRIECFQFIESDTDLSMKLSNPIANTEDFKGIIVDKENWKTSWYETIIVSIKLPEKLDSLKKTKLTIPLGDGNMYIKWNVIGANVLGISKNEREEEKGDIAVFVTNKELIEGIQISVSKNRLIVDIDNSLNKIAGCYLNLNIFHGI